MNDKTALANNKGSTLLVIVLLFALLAVMGTSILTTTAAHVRTQKEQGKYDFQGSETGIDAMITVMTDKRKEVNEEAANEANRALRSAKAEQYDMFMTYLNEKIQKENGVVPEFDYENFEDYFEYPALDFSDPNVIVPPPLYEVTGAANQTNALEYATSVHNKAFTTKFADWLTKSFVILDADTPDRELEVKWADYIKNNIDVSAGEADFLSFENETKTGLRTDDISFINGILVLPVFSIYNERGEGVGEFEKHTRNLVTATVEIAVPDYTLPLTLEQEVAKFEPSILWTKALTSNGKISVMGNSKVYGNIYAGGGIITSGKVEINGEAVTGGDVVQSENGASLTVNGNVYANSIVAGNADYDINDVTLSINTGDKRGYTSYSLIKDDYDNISVGSQKPVGDSVVQNNLELRGRNSNINIAGNFTGFSDPLDYNDKVPLSSCVIVDTPDFDETAAFDKPRLVINGDTVICGAAYVEFGDNSDSSRFFSTGEGIALRGNYRGYSNFLHNFNQDDPESESNYFDNFLYSFFDYNNKIVKAGDYNEGYMNYISFSGLKMPVEYKIDDKYETIYVENKADYFYEMAKMEADGKYDALKDELGDRNIKYDNGILQFNGNFYCYGVSFKDGKIFPKNQGDFLEKVEKQSKAKEMFERQINFFGDLKLNSIGELPSLKDENRLFRSESDECLFDDSGSFGHIIAAEGADIAATDNDIIISGAGETVRGVIVTKGTVTINNGVEFYGTIIAEKGIVLQENAVVYNDRDAIAKAMYVNSELYNRFSHTLDTKLFPTYSTVEGYSINRPITREDFIYSEILDASLTNKYAAIKDVISVKNRRVVEYSESTFLQ